jgi:hypothetical protein
MLLIIRLLGVMAMAEGRSYWKKVLVLQEQACKMGWNIFMGL